jgi:hypothetical protein
MPKQRLVSEQALANISCRCGSLNSSSIDWLFVPEVKHEIHELREQVPLLTLSPNCLFWKFEVKPLIQCRQDLAINANKIKHNCRNKDEFQYSNSDT